MGTKDTITPKAGEDRDGNMRSDGKTFDSRVVSHMNNSFYLNFKRYNGLEKPQKLNLVKQLK